LTVRDLATRYVLTVHPLKKEDVQSTRRVFERLFRSYGMPRAIRVDNGCPFGSKGPAGLTRLSAWWVKLGIEVQFIRPGRPEDNAEHEQFHKVMQAEVVRKPAKTWRGQHRRTTKWVKEYNYIRPHEALRMRSPRKFYRRSPRKLRPGNWLWKYPKEWVTRWVKSNGMIYWRGRGRFIGEAFGKERIGLKKRRAQTWQVHFATQLIGELRETDSGGMRPAVYRHAPQSK
jgi:hypothetical protein